MAIDDLSILQAQLPEVFDPHSLPDQWDDWITLPIENPESQSAEQIEDVDMATQAETLAPKVLIVDPWYEYFQVNNPAWADRQEDRTNHHPGQLVTYDGRNPYPPPDALAFYLPYHYYFPRWWGVYLIAEGVRSLARMLRKQSEGMLDWKDAVVAARLFLYAHEAFHHLVESFATRLEVTHRTPLYKAGFESRYQATYDTHECLEEALATAKGYQRALQAYRGSRKKQLLIAEGLITYIKGCPSGYSEATKYLKPKAFKAGVNDLAEEYHRHSLRGISKKDAELWLLFPHAFSGISRITSRVNYLIKRHSSLAERLKLDARFLRQRELQRKLEKLAGCHFERQGAKHEVWMTPNGKSFTIPRHPGDLNDKTIRAIHKQSEVQMTFKDFMAAKA